MQGEFFKVNFMRGGNKDSVSKAPSMQGELSKVIQKFSDARGALQSQCDASRPPSEVSRTGFPKLLLCKGSFPIPLWCKRSFPKSSKNPLMQGKFSKVNKMPPWQGLGALQSSCDAREAFQSSCGAMGGFQSQWDRVDEENVRKRKKVQLYFSFMPFDFHYQKLPMHLLGAW